MIQLHTKAALRQLILAQRTQNDNIDYAIEQYLYQIIDIQRCKNICAYLPIKNEVNIKPALCYFFKNNLTIYMPVVIAAKQALTFRLWHPNISLSIGKYNIPEPNIRDNCSHNASYNSLEHSEINIQSMQHINAILIPCMGFFKQNSSIYRLGYGGGFYDRTIAEAKKHGAKFKCIGICHSSKQLSGLNAEIHDMPLDMVITPSGIIY